MTEIMATTLRLVLLCIHVTVTSCGSAFVSVGCSDGTPSVGRVFTALFQETRGITRPPSLFVAPTLPNFTPIIVTASPTYYPAGTLVTKVAGGGELQQLSVTSDLRAKGVGVQEKGIRIEADADVSVFAWNGGQGSCDGFLLLPHAALGTDYFAVAHHPAVAYTQLGVVAISHATDVTVTLVRDQGVVVRYNGQTYTGGEQITATLNTNEALHLQSSWDLTGSRVTSSKPVAVFSGNVHTEVNPPGASYGDLSHLAEQVPPTAAWGYTFYLVPLPGRDTGDQVKLMAAKAGTVATITGLSPANFSAAGHSLYNVIPSGQYTVIKADKPLLVVQFARSNIENFQGERDPAMMLVPSVEQYTNEYVFSTMPLISPRYEHYLLLVVPLGWEEGLRLDGQPLPRSPWHLFPGSSPAMVGKHVLIANGVHTATHSLGVAFGAMVYGSDPTNCAYAYPAGMCLTQPLESLNNTTRRTCSGCGIIEINNATHHACVEGAYHKTATLYNDRPVYRHVSGSLLLYYVFAEKKFWIVGPTLGATRGYVLSRTEATNPGRISNPWRTYDPDTRKWSEEPNLSVTCSCPEVDCDRIGIESNSSLVLGGMFLALPDSINGRPVYRHAFHSLYLYFSVTDLCQYWVIGPTLGDNVGLMFTYDASTSPRNINSTWTTLIGGSWNIDNSVDMFCL